MIILSLICGLGIGTFLPMDLSVIISAGMIASIITPVLSPIVTMGIMGIGVAVTAKNIIKTAFKNKAESFKIQQPTAAPVQVAEVAAEAAKSEFKFFTSTMTFTAVPMMMLQAISSLYQFLLPVSVLALVVKSWMTITSSPAKALKYGFLGLLIAGAAFLTISSGSASSVFLYFLTLVSLPSALAKQKPTESVINNSTMPLEAFLYGQGGNGSIITGMVLVQTILWGSGKDTLGTIVNGAGSLLLDPSRICIFGVVIAFMLWFTMSRQTVELEKLKANLINKKKEKRLLGVLVNLVSLGFALTAVNPFLAIGFTIVGLVLNALVDTSVIRSMSVPALLICGVMFG